MASHVHGYAYQHAEDLFDARCGKKAESFGLTPMALRM
jgi:hypothetical protein